MKSWIKIDREITSHWIFSDPWKFRNWIDLLTLVNHQEQKVNIKGVILTCKRGETLCSLDTLAKRWNCDKSKVRRFLKLLESDSMIVLKSEQITTRLTICKYELYQGERNANETKTKRKRNGSETQMTPNKNEKNEYNEENENNLTNPTEVELVISTRKKFLIPSISEISTYCKERNNEVNPEQFYDHYQSNGWMVGKNKMKDWKAAVRTWEKNGYSKPHQSNNNQITTQNGTLQERKYAHVYKAIRNLERLGSLNTEQVEVAKRYLEHATGNIDTTEFIGKLVKYDSRNAKSDFEDIRDSLRIGE
jgi:predicted transcriptional regulator